MVSEMPPGSEFTVDRDIVLVDAFSAHAVMVATIEPGQAAVPGVLVDLDGMIVGDEGRRVSVRILLERPGAEGVVAGIATSVAMLENIRRNQEGPRS